MTDTDLLRLKIDESGYKMRFIAEKCGITYQAFLNRLNNKVEFRADEVRVLIVLLDLTDDEVAKIFYQKV